MKYLIVLGFILLPQAVWSQITLSSIQGKWQEYQRLSKQQKPIEFTDTLRFECLTSGQTMIRFQEGVTIISEAEINQDQFKVKDITFTQVYLKQGDLYAKRNGVMHVFKPQQQFTNAPIVKKIPGANEGEIKTDQLSVVGKWSCYRKTDPSFSKTTFYIKQLDIKSIQGSDNDAIVSLHSMDSLYYVPMSVKINSKSIQLKSKDLKTMSLEIIKSDGEEMVLQDGSVVYYFKQFGLKKE